MDIEHLMLKSGRPFDARRASNRSPQDYQASCMRVINNHSENVQESDVIKSQNGNFISDQS